MSKTAMFLQKEKKSGTERKDHKHFPKATTGKDCFMPPLFTNIYSISSQHLGLKIAAARKHCLFQRKPNRTFCHVLNSKH